MNHIDADTPGASRVRRGGKHLIVWLVLFLWWVLYDAAIVARAAGLVSTREVFAAMLTFVLISGGFLFTVYFVRR